MVRNSLTMMRTEAEEFVWTAIRATINKFREHPAYFFTESDITSYLYKRLYTSRLAVRAHDRLIYCVHREYPTNFRYSRDKLIEAVALPSLLDPSGKRGHYDLAVLSPNFVRDSDGFIEVVNKNIKGVQERNLDGTEEQLLFAVEVKYVISNSKEWSHQVDIDNHKLLHARSHNVVNAVNLVFCNNAISASRVTTQVVSAPAEVCAVLTQSVYDELGIKSTPRPIMNAKYQGPGRAAIRL